MIELITSKRFLAIFVTLVLLVGAFAGCSKSSENSVSVSPESTGEASASSEGSQSGEDAGEVQDGDQVLVRIGTLKGPTGMGMVGVMESSEDGTSENAYEFTLKAAPEDVRTMVISGEVDIAAMPSNMASVLYNKAPGSIQILAVNTLGVLYILDTGNEIGTVADLAGKTVYATGQGAAPEYILNYILTQNGVNADTDVTMEYLSEHSELATRMIAGEVALGMLPEPFVTTTTAKNDDILVALDLNEEWSKVAGGAALAMGCIVVRTDFVRENPEAVAAFLREYEESVNFVNRDISDAAVLMEKFDIITQEVAETAIPMCNIVYMDGGDMENSVKSFLTVLNDANPAAIGGTLPDEGFYYKK